MLMYAIYFILKIFHLNALIFVILNHLLGYIINKYVASIKANVVENLIRSSCVVDKNP